MKVQKVYEVGKESSSLILTVSKIITPGVLSSDKGDSSNV